MADQYELQQVRIQMKEALPIYSTSRIQSPEDAARVMADALAMMDREYCCVVNLDNRNRPINYNVVSIGDVNSAIVPIQNVFKSAILSNAAGIMLFHNHPSGELTPSREDEILTEKLIYAGKIMNINVIDHIIVGGNEGKHYSFREGESFLFDAEPGLEDGIVLDSKTMKDQLKEITDRLEAGIEEIFTSENYKNYLATMAKFHKYSFNNTLLIALQNPEATLVAGYSAWQKKFHRQVRKGEKSIKIIAPMTFRRDMEVEKVDPLTQEIILGPDGQPEKETRQVNYQRFKVSSVFDVSQTFGDPIPSLEVPVLTGDAEHFDVFMEAVRKISPVPIRFDQDQVNDFYEIYQIDPEGEARNQMFLGYDYLESHGLSVKSDDYQNIYHGDLKEGMTLEGLYEKFNLYRPEDFKGHSLSVGDVVLLNRSGRKQTFFVDTIGFKEISGFDQGLKLMKDAKKRPDVSKERKTVTRDVRKETGLCR